MRKQQVQHRHLLATPFILETLLTRIDSPGYEGIQLTGGVRDPWGYDDSANYLKHTLCQIQVDLQAAIARRYEKDGEIQKGSIPDPWKPFRELCANLLPHMRFFCIDSTNRDQIRCLWKVHDRPDPVDLDELSSGEKSIIQMFFPLVERAIRELLAKVSDAATDNKHADQCILIDEPELHLHPNLQMKVLDYLRVLTTGTQMQVIVASHSPTVVESADFSELFLLRPVELLSTEENQLVQVATDDDRLQLLRSLFGTTSNLTSMQPIVVVEGVQEQDARRVMPDRKLYRAMHPGFDHVTVIAGGGKSECRALVQGLRGALASFSGQLRAVALVDRDYAMVPSDDTDVFVLPVTMIENFLLDPEVIWQAIQSVSEKAGFLATADVDAALSKILDEFETEEVDRRAVSKLGTAMFRPSRPLKDISAKAHGFCGETLSRFSETSVASVLDVAAAEVAALRKIGASTSKPQRREEFHGKGVLQAFYARHLHKTSLAKVVFTFEAARYARDRKSVKLFFDDFFQKLDPKWRVTDGTQGNSMAAKEVSGEAVRMAIAR